MSREAKSAATSSHPDSSEPVMKSGNNCIKMGDNESSKLRTPTFNKIKKLLYKLHTDSM